MQTSYSAQLKQGIERKGISLAQVCFRLAKKDVFLDKAVLSKMQNGKHPPAKDDANMAIAEVLGIDPNKLRLAAAREILPESLIELIRQTGNTNDAKKERQLV